MKYLYLKLPNGLRGEGEFRNGLLPTTGLMDNHSKEELISGILRTGNLSIYLAVRSADGMMQTIKFIVANLF